jgi:hypothetical protein
MFPVFLALVPLFFVVRDLRLLGTYHGLILVYTAYSLPFTVFFPHGFFRSLPARWRGGGRRRRGPSASSSRSCCRWPSRG